MSFPKSQIQILAEKSRYRRIWIGTLILLCCILIGLSFGTVPIPIKHSISILTQSINFINLESEWTDAHEIILLKLRFPRVILACIVGAALASSGAAFQGLFRNPLADPYLIGVAGGAGLGAAITLLLKISFLVNLEFFLPIAAFSGAIVTVLTAYFISLKSGKVSLISLILAGVAISASTSAVTAFLMIRSNPDLRPLVSWLLGGFQSAEWNQILILLFYLIPSWILMMAYSRTLNTLQLDEKMAKQLGVNIEKTKVIIICTATLTTAAAVAFSGIIGFVGLIAPHAVRLIWNNDYRTLIPTSALLGGSFMIIADLISRTIIAPSELPVGIITTLFGTPFFLYLLRKHNKSS